MVVLILIVLTIVLLLIMLAAIWGMNAAMARMVGDKHRALEEITTTGQVPAVWRRRHERKIARLRADPTRKSELAASEQRATADYVRRLDKLVTYAETTELVDEEETREMVLEQLAVARSQWLDAAGLPTVGTTHSSVPGRG